MGDNPASVTWCAGSPSDLPDTLLLWDCSYRELLSEASLVVNTSIDPGFKSHTIASYTDNTSTIIPQSPRIYVGAYSEDLANFHSNNQHSANSFTSPPTNWPSLDHHRTETSSPTELSTSLDSQTGSDYPSDRKRRRDTPVSSFSCKWEGCTYKRPFNREIDLVRHLRTIHISPFAYKCHKDGCSKAFSRKDKLREHLVRSHREKDGRTWG